VKRTALTRRSPLTRGAGLRRLVRLKPRNAIRAAKRRDEAFGPQSKRCEASRCPACITYGHGVEGTGGRIVAHHEHSRGAGGKDESTVPLCWMHHDARHSEGPAFWQRVGVDVEELLAFMRGGGVVDAAWAAKVRDDLPVSLSLGRPL